MPRGGPGARMGCPGTARPAWTGRAAGGCRPGGCRGCSPAPATGYCHVTPAPAAAACPGGYAGAAGLNPPGGRASSITPGSCCGTGLTPVPAQRRAASACPREVENADQTGGFVDREYDEPEIANVGDPPSRHSGRRAEHRSYGSSQILTSSVTSMSNACSARPYICRSAPDSRCGP